MKGVKEYFQEKERELHKRIEVGEVSRMRYEQLESEAQEKATVADQERQRERQELTELRDQITEIEKSYSNQIKNTELRAGDAIVSAIHCALCDVIVRQFLIMSIYIILIASCEFDVQCIIRSEIRKHKCALRLHV